MKNINIGIAGLGTVGSGVIKYLRLNKQLLKDRSLLDINILAVSARNKNKKRSLDVSESLWVDDPVNLANIKDLDIVVELIGGETGKAFELAEKCIKNHKPLVTANKAMIATHGLELCTLSEKNNTNIGFEAAVAGGIPVLKALREGLVANNISSVYGILNGTCNYVLSQMSEKGISFDKAIREAQKLGYAESDPSEDISGKDTASKLSILSSLAFGCKSNVENFFTEGIKNISHIDIEMAKKLGYRIVLLGISSFVKERLTQRVHPCMIPVSSIISKVNGVLNTVIIEGDLINKTILIGEGAGSKATTSSVISDIIDIANSSNYRAFGVLSKNLKTPLLSSFSERTGKFYIRLLVNDIPGVVADVSMCFKEANVSIASLIQLDNSDHKSKFIPLVFTTHESSENEINLALSKISKLGSIKDKPNLVRIESL